MVGPLVDSHPDTDFAPKLPLDDRRLAMSIQAQLIEMDSALRLVAVVPGLENRYGCFADVDGDGDLDYVASTAATTVPARTLDL